MTLQGRVQNGVVVLTNGASLPDGTVVSVAPVEEVPPAPPLIAPGQKPPYAVSKEQKEALLGRIGMWKMDHPPDDEEVKRIIEEHRMKKYG